MQQLDSRLRLCKTSTQVKRSRFVDTSRRSLRRQKGTEFLSSQAHGNTFCTSAFETETDNVPNWPDVAQRNVLKLSLQTKLWHHRGSWTEETVLSDFLGFFPAYAWRRKDMC